ncbi:hypothetical protein [Streptomyces sp. NPDC093105]|uniref:hypothetical protein n=1 Tax=Streptomyces sp. NPDC093105 TaxID=3366029 RepID=UPI0038076CD8
MPTDPDPDPDRRTRLLLGGCLGVLVGALVLTAVAMLLMSVALTGFYDRDGDDSKPPPVTST